HPSSAQPTCTRPRSGRGAWIPHRAARATWHNRRAMTTIAEQLAAFSAGRPDEPAVTCGEESLTWRQLAEAAARMGAHFGAAGAGPGTIVTIGLPNSVKFVEAAFGAWWVGATPSPISHRLPAVERQAIIALAKPAVVVGVPVEDAPGFPVLNVEDL